MKKTSAKIAKEIKSMPLKFALYWLLIFFVLVSLASLTGILEDSNDEAQIDNELNTNLADVISELPKKIIIEKVGVEVDINNPESANIEILDNLLNSGAVRYPGSGLAGEKSNVFLFGHSSHLPIVLNKNYKAFNNIEKLVSGDIIKLQSDNTEFLYEVFDIKKANAEDFRIDFNTNSRLLTLSTCDNFGDLSDRFVVQAELIATQSLESF